MSTWVESGDVGRLWRRWWRRWFSAATTATTTTAAAAAAATTVGYAYGSKATTAPSCGIDDAIAFLFAMQKRVSWHEDNLDDSSSPSQGPARRGQSLGAILRGVSPPAIPTSAIPTSVEAAEEAVATPQQRNGLAVLVSGDARTLDSTDAADDLRTLAEVLRSEVRGGPLKLFAWLSLRGDNGSAYTPPARRAEVQRVLSAAGLEYELLEHDDGRRARHSLLPARVDSAGCRQYAGVAMVQYAKLAAATAMMARDEARSSRVFGSVLRVRPDYCFGAAVRFLRVALSHVQREGTLAFIVHDGLAVYPRRAASAFARLGAASEMHSLLSRTQPPGLRNNWRALAAQRSACARRLWQTLVPRFGCPPSSPLPRFAAEGWAALRPAGLVSVKSLLQLELLVGSGVYALDLAHWWGSSGLPLGEGGATPGGRGHAPTSPLVHDGVDQLRRSRAWWVRHPRLVNSSALDTGQWRTRCANFD